MANFGSKSKERLMTCESDIQRVLELAIQKYDFVVLCGVRTPQEQFELFKQGRKLVNGKWEKIGSTVTNIDGKTTKSMHNYIPSKAVDIAPYPIDWNNLDRFKDMAKVVLACAKELGVSLEWGGNWVSFKDFPHFQLG